MSVMEEGDAGDAFFVTLEGRLEVRKGETVVATLEQGTHFGEMAMVDRSPRSATVVTVAPSRLLSVHRETFYDLLRKDPQLAVKLLWSFVQVLTVRLRQSTTELAHRLTEQDIVDGMEPLFDAAQQAAGRSAFAQPSTDVGDADDLEALDEDAIEELEIDEDVLSPAGAFDALKLVARGARPPTPPPPPPPPTPSPAAAPDDQPEDEAP